MLRPGRTPATSDVLAESHTVRIVPANAVMRLRADRLGAVEGEAPGGKVEAFELGSPGCAAGTARRRSSARRRWCRGGGGSRAATELGRDRKASGDISTTGKPRYMVAKQPPMRPMSWYSGSQLTNTSSLRGARRLAHRAHVGEQVGVRQHHAFRVAGAARGVLQEADVARRGRAPARSLRRLAVKSAGTSTARSDSTCARSSQASGFASGIVTMIAAPALFRMPTWRVMWSSMVDEARRRVERHRHAAREQRAVEAEQVLAARSAA